MKTEEEIEEALRQLNKNFYNEDYKQEETAGAIKALKWVLED